MLSYRLAGLLPRQKAAFLGPASAVHLLAATVTCVRNARAPAPIELAVRMVQLYNALQKQLQ